MREKMLRNAMTVALFGLLCGCGTSPSVHYYTLSEPAAETIAKTGTAIVAIGPFTVPDYLQKPYIVIRESDQRMRFAEYHRWVEAPQDALVAWLARDVDRQLAIATVVPFPSASYSDAGYRVRGAIAQWDVDERGTAVLVVQWDCQSRDDSSVLPLRTSRYTAQAGKPADYASLVQALNRTAADFGHDITTALRSALPANGPEEQAEKK
jgi:uncharacterized lipoprotein YmbA